MKEHDADQDEDDDDLKKGDVDASVSEEDRLAQLELSPADMREWKSSNLGMALLFQVSCQGVFTVLLRCI